MSFLKKYAGKVIVLTSEHCPSCKILKERASRDQGLKDAMVFKDVEKDDVGKMFREVFNVMSVPSYFTVNTKRGRVYVCKLDDNMNLTEWCVEVETDKRSRDRKKA